MTFPPVTIESVAYGGKGVVRVDGKVYFIEGAVTGDVVTFEVTEDAERYANARITSFVEHSSLRGPSPCRFEADCGGCQWMGVPYAQQLEWKKSFVSSALKRIGKLPDGIEPEIIGSPEPHGYRNRVLVRVHIEADGRLELGYFRRGTHELVAIDACAIAAPALNAGIASLLKLDTTGLAGFRARVEFQEIPPVDGATLVATIYPGDGRSEAATRFTDLVRALPGMHWAGLAMDLNDAPMVPFEDDLGIRFLTIPGQFQQVNLALNRTLRRLVKDYVDAAAPARLLDLFCGGGNLSLPLVDGVRYVEGIESNKKSIACAKRAVSANGLANATYIAGDAEAHLWKCAKGGEKFDLIILDPPRQGMHQGMIPLKNIEPERVIYVSCDPTTLARDLAALTRKDRYAIERLVCLDFFPNTYHVETVVFLRRSPP